MDEKNHASEFRKPRAIVAKKDGRELRFETVSEASRYFNVSVSMINRVLQGRRETTRGWCFEYAG